MTNPYHQQPDFAFWKRAVSDRPASEVDPVTVVPFRIGASDKVAAAGSCFAQHIAQTLTRYGFNYLVTEPQPQTAAAIDENYGIFPARFGNVYTVRQLLQLFQRAYGLLEPIETAWVRADGAYVDPYRPRVQRAGFRSVDDLRADRDAHLRAARQMFEQCDVFVFTLGLTEAWESCIDGMVFPLAPGVVAHSHDPNRHRFHNFTVPEMEADLLAFIDHLTLVNPKVRTILTVSPVSLIATFESRHVLVSTTYSKAALRVVAETVTAGRPNLAYFPAYEIITGPQARAQFYEDDLREVTPAGVEFVMSVFVKHYLQMANAAAGATGQAVLANEATAQFDEASYLRQVQQVICDETAIDWRGN